MTCWRRSRWWGSRRRSRRSCVHGSTASPTRSASRTTAPPTPTTGPASSPTSSKAEARLRPSVRHRDARDADHHSRQSDEEAIDELVHLGTELTDLGPYARDLGVEEILRRHFVEIVSGELSEQGFRLLLAEDGFGPLGDRAAVLLAECNR